MKSNSFLAIGSCLLVCLSGILLSHSSCISSTGLVYFGSGGGDPLPLPPNPPPPPPPPPGISFNDVLI